jgi:anaerobic selenocysteine-containing dehydrogenase
MLKIETHPWQAFNLHEHHVAECLSRPGRGFVMDRFPYPFIQINPQDMAELGVKQGDLVEVYNDNGSTQTIAYSVATPSASTRSCCRLSERRAGQRGLRWSE